MFDHYHCELENGEHVFVQWRLWVAGMLAQYLGLTIDFTRSIEEERFWDHYRFLENNVVDDPVRGMGASLSTALGAVFMFPIARAGEAAVAFREVFGARAARRLGKQALHLAALVEHVFPIDFRDRTVTVLRSTAGAILSPQYVEQTWARLMTETVNDIGDATYDHSEFIKETVLELARQVRAQRNIVG
jgi:hypothetical protein